MYHMLHQVKDQVDLKDQHSLDTTIVWNLMEISPGAQVNKIDVDLRLLA